MELFSLKEARDGVRDILEGLKSSRREKDLFFAIFKGRTRTKGR